MSNAHLACADVVRKYNRQSQKLDDFKNGQVVIGSVIHTVLYLQAGEQSIDEEHLHAHCGGGHVAHGAADFALRHF